MAKSIKMDAMRQITRFLRIGLGGIWFHGALLRGNNYHLFTYSSGGATIQVCGPKDENGGRFVYASRNLSTRTANLTRAEWERLGTVSKNWTISAGYREKRHNRNR